MNELKSFIVLYGGKFVRVYKQNAVDKLIAAKFKDTGMFEIEINQRLYLFNTANIKYILLGDGSLTSDQSARVRIGFSDGDIHQFCFDNCKAAKELYNKLKRLVLPAKEFSITK